MAPRISSSSRVVAVEAIDPAAFAPFGEVIQNPDTHNGKPNLQSAPANQGTAINWLGVTKMRNWYSLSQSRKPAEVAMNMFVSQPRKLEHKQGKEVFTVKIMERHPFTPQTFVPLGLAKDCKTRYMVVVAPTLPLRSRETGTEETLQPAYPLPPPRRKRSLRERLLGARPNPFTNDFSSSTTPQPSDPSGPRPKGAGLPDLDNIRAFILRGDQAVTYGVGTWHAPMVVLGEREVEFVVTQYKNGVAIEDCQEIEFDVEDGGDGIVVDVNGSVEQGDIRAKL